MKYYKILLYTLILVPFCSFANWRTEDALLKCYTRDNIAPLSLHAISGKILATVKSGENEFDDIIVELDKWYPGARYYKYIKHKGKSPIFSFVSDVKLPYAKAEGKATSTTVKTEDGLYMLWKYGDTLYVAKFIYSEMAFVKVKEIPLYLGKYRINSLYAETVDGGYRLWFGQQNGYSSKVPGDDRKGDYFPYDGSGRYRGSFPYVGLFYVDLDANFNIVSEPEMASDADAEVLMTYCNITGVAYGDNISGLVVGSHFGGLYYYGGSVPMKKKYLVGEDGNALRHPGIWANPVSYPSQKGMQSDLIATCEGGIYYYRFTGKFTEEGNPIYDEPEYLLEDNPTLYGGSLAVPTVADWDNDGKLDIIAGNSQGFLYFFKNMGTNADPKFTVQKSLCANGNVIHVQPGYKEDIQGPQEARWGYLCPKVFDWNGDGKLDIITNDSRSRHMVYIGTSGPVTDRLESEHPLYVNDLDLKGTWRCRPGISQMDGYIAYITLDDDNELHLYSRIDDYNLQDRGKLFLEDGSLISASKAESGGTGRLKIEIVDWDGDGIKDLILGTCKHHHIPNNQKGLPGMWHEKNKQWSSDKPKYSKESLNLKTPVYFDSAPDFNPGATVLFMKNVGDNEKPVYAYPVQLKYKDEIIKLGQHSLGVESVFLGEITDGLPNLLIGDERGHFYLLERKDLSW